MGQSSQANSSVLRYSMPVPVLSLSLISSPVADPDSSTLEAIFNQDEYSLVPEAGHARMLSQNDGLYGSRILETDAEKVAASHDRREELPDVQVGLRLDFDCNILIGAESLHEDLRSIFNMSIGVGLRLNADPSLSFYFGSNISFVLSSLSGTTAETNDVVNDFTTKESVEDLEIGREYLADYKTSTELTQSLVMPGIILGMNVLIASEQEDGVTVTWSPYINLKLNQYRRIVRDDKLFATYQGSETYTDYESDTPWICGIMPFLPLCWPLMDYEKTEKTRYVIDHREEKKEVSDEEAYGITVEIDPLSFYGGFVKGGVGIGFIFNSLLEESPLVYVNINLGIHYN